MIQLSRWKVVLVALAALLGVLLSLPNAVPKGVLPSWLPQQTLNLGLDLQGGSHLLLEVDTDALHRERVSNLIEDIRIRLREKQIVPAELGAIGDSVTLRITDPAQLPEARKVLDQLAQIDPQTGQRDLTTRQSGDRLTLSLSKAALNQQSIDAVDQSIEIIRRRVDELGTKEPTILKQGRNRIVVQAPGESDPERLKRVIGQTAKLTFQMVAEEVTASEIAAGRVPPDAVLLPAEELGGAPMAVKRRALVTGEMLLDAKPDFDQNGRSVVSFRFNSEGTKRFGQATQQNVQRRFAIILDNKVISAPVIQEPILLGQGQISGQFTPETSKDLALVLRSGALPAPLNVEEQRTVGAELGKDAIDRGLTSTVLGMVLVLIFMILAYGFLFGGISIIALIVNGLLIVAAMSVTQATLTLPGIAGLILTLAVAVDANVLIYERIRDEYRAGRKLIPAIDAGFNRAIITIFDANITHLGVAAIMFALGSGPVKGFAWTLFIGVFTSVFTAVMITQVLLAVWLRVARPKTLPIA